MGLDTVELLYTIEKHFDIDIPNREAEQITTVGDFQQTVWEHLQHGPAPNQLSRTEVDAAIVRIISDFAGADPSEVTPGKSITNDLGLD